MAATHTTKECIWLWRLIKLFGSPSTPTILYCDNQATVHLTMDNNYHARTKHINIHFHFICQTIANGHMKIMYRPTQDMMADILTKALLRHKVTIHSQNLRICCSWGGVMHIAQPCQLNHLKPLKRSGIILDLPHYQVLQSPSPLNWCFTQHAHPIQFYLLFVLIDLFLVKVSVGS